LSEHQEDVVRLILFAQTLFGLWSVVRTLQFFRARALLQTSTVTKTGTIFVFTVILIASFSVGHSFATTILILSAWICNFGTLLMLERRQIDSLKREFPKFLDRWILNLKLGQAPSRARDLALQMHLDAFRTLMQPIFAVGERVSLPRTHLLFSKSVSEELARIGIEPHLALARLETMRRNVRQAEVFRRRSGQAVRQTRIQSAVMLFILFALIAFTIARYGPEKMADLILMSVILSICGVFTMHLLAKRVKWKV
jgi:hypothetical protein